MDHIWTKYSHHSETKNIHGFNFPQFITFHHEYETDTCLYMDHEQIAYDPYMVHIHTYMDYIYIDRVRSKRGHVYGCLGGNCQGVNSDPNY